MYKVEWSEKARKSLEKLDWVRAKKIRYQVENYLAKNPKEGNLRGQHSYHWSSYRVIYEILEVKLVILIIEVDDRKEIYQPVARRPLSSISRGWMVTKTLKYII